MSQNGRHPWIDFERDVIQARPAMSRQRHVIEFPQGFIHFWNLVNAVILAPRDESLDLECTFDTSNEIELKRHTLMRLRMGRIRFGILWSSRDCPPRALISRSENDYFN